jgi:hypothetical protein
LRKLGRPGIDAQASQPETADRRGRLLLAGAKSLGDEMDT